MSGAVLGDPDVVLEDGGPVRVERLPAQHTKPVLILVRACLQVEGRPQGRQREAALLATRSGLGATDVHFAWTCPCCHPLVGSPEVPCVAFSLLKTLTQHVADRKAKIHADVVGFSLTN